MLAIVTHRRSEQGLVSMEAMPRSGRRFHPTFNMLGKQTHLLVLAAVSWKAAAAADNRM